MSNSLKVDREALTARLKTAIGFIPKNAIIPMYENFFCSIENNMMQIIASSGSNIQIRLFCPVESKTNWAFCPNAKKFLSMAANYQDNVIKITEKSKSKIEIKCGESRANVPLDCLPENFDPMVISNINSEIVIHQSMLKRALDVVKDFINPEHPNNNFRVLNIAEINNKIIFTGVTHSLMCRAAIRPISITSWKQAAIPVDSIKNVIKTLDNKGEVNVTHSEGKICFRVAGAIADTIEIISVMHNSPFPDTEKPFSVCPADFITIDAVALKNCLTRLNIYANEDLPVFSIDNKEDSQKLRLLTSDENIGGELEEFLPITNSSQLIIDKSYRIDQFMDVISSIDCAEIHLHFSDYHNAFVLPVVNTEEENIFNCLIVEVRKVLPVTA